jgi:hypothetical protein
MRAFMNGGQLVLVISVVASIITLGGMFYANYLDPTTLFGLSSLLHEHQTSVASQEAEAAPLPRMIDEMLTQSVKAGDAVRPQNLIIEEDFIDPENHCEFCQRYEYTPGAAGKAGIAYDNDNGKAINLAGANKVSFFVMGEDGGERLKFKVGGRDSDSEGADRGSTDRPDRGNRGSRGLAAAPNNLNNGGDSALKIKDDLFPGKAFARTTEEVAITDDWKKYEIDLTGVDMASTENPFAIEIMKKSGNAKQVFYVKGITFDTEHATEPLATVEANTTLLDSNLTALNQTELAIGNGSVSEAETDEADYSGDSENGTTTSGDLAVEDENQTPIGSARLDNATINEQETDIENENNTSTRLDIGEDQQNTTVEADNRQPNAIARPDEILAHPGDTVILDATASEDPDGDDLSFRWDSGDDDIEIVDNQDTPTPTARVSSDLEEDTEITVELVVSDGNLESEPFEVTIVVDYHEPTEVPDDESFSDAEELQIQIDPDALVDVQLEIEEIGTIGNWQPESGCTEDLTSCLSDDSDDSVVSTAEESADIFLFDASELLDTEAEISINYVSVEADARSLPDGLDSSPTAFIAFVMYDEEQEEFYLTPAISVSSDSFESYSYRWQTSPIDDNEWTDSLEQSLLAGYVYSGGNSGTELSEFTLTISYYESMPANNATPANEAEDESEEQLDSEEDENDSLEEPPDDDSAQPDDRDTPGNATETSSVEHMTDEESSDGSTNDNQNNTAATE